MNKSPVEQWTSTIRVVIHFNLYQMTMTMMHGADLWFIGDFTLFCHIWPNLTQKQIFSDKMTILSCKTIFRLNFSAILENLLELFLQSPKNCDFGHCLAHLAKIDKIFSKIMPCYFLPLLSPNFYAKFQKNLWSGFRDQFVRYRRTDTRTRVISQNRLLSLVQYASP